LLESVVTSTKISVMPSDSSRSNNAASSLAAHSSSRYRPPNLTSAGRSSTLRFDKRVLPNYSSSFMSSSLTSLSHKSDALLSRQIGAIPALPVQQLSCEQCGRSYACEYTLKRHIRLECGKEATLQCPLCPRRTKHKHSLLRHINKFHPGAHI
jgi:MoaA/NifB/PqqE/SkfB family radical SAM enzyme